MEISIAENTTTATWSGTVVNASIAENVTTVTYGTAVTYAPAAGTATYSVTSGTAVWADATDQVEQYVKAGTAIVKGQAVYVTGATGANVIIGLAQANAEATSSKTLGLALSTLANNDFGYVVTQGLIEGIDTSAAGAAGDPVWLSPSTPGGLVYGVANKPVAPNHMVYIGVVVRKQQNNGAIFVSPQNGFELQELHNVLITSVANNDVLKYDSAQSLWVNTSTAPLAGTATYATTAGTATYATTSGTATYAVSSGTATYAVTAGTSTYATTAGTSTYATVAGTATTAGTASYATTSGTAVYATTAGTATYATTSGTATYATSAGNATTAGTATYATTSGTAVYATTSGTATYATTAGTSSYATTAGTATYATNAGTAVYATTAGGAAPTGSAGGDLTGTYPNPTIATTATPRITALGVGTVAPAAGVTVAGGVMSLPASTASYASLNIPVSTTAPSSPAIGDIWARLGKLYFQNALGTGSVAVSTADSSFTVGQTITASGSNALTINNSSAYAINVNAGAGSGNFIVDGNGAVQVTPTSSATTMLNVKIGADASQGATITRNSATQTGALFALYQSNGSTVLSSFGAQGNLTIRNDNGAATTIPLSVTANASQSVNLFQILASDNSTVRFGVSSSGQLTVAPSSGTAATINAATASSLGLVVKAAALQSANLQEWQDSTGTALVSIAPNGPMTFPQATVIQTNAGAIVARFRGAASQSANLTEWQSSTPATLAGVTPSGGIFTGNRLTVGQSSINTGSIGYLNTVGAANIGFILQGQAAQTADLTQWQASGGTVLGGRNAVAQLFTGSTSGILSTIGAATKATGTSSGTTATITTNDSGGVATAHNLAVGDLVTLSAFTPTGYNGTYAIQTVPTSSTFTVTTSGSNLGAGTGGTVQVPAQASITARSAGTVGLVVKNAASAVANQQEWQNSSGTVVARMAVGGELLATTVGTLNQWVVGRQENSGGVIRITKGTAAATNPGAGIGAIYFRDGTNANTLKLVVRAGTAGAETTILDNIPT